MSVSNKRNKTMNRILDAALECYATAGPTRVTLEQVANQAGVTRTTLYRYVSNRDDLLDKVLHRDGQLVQADSEQIFRSQPDFGAALVESMLYTIRGRLTRPINRILFPGGDSSPLLTAERFYDMAYPLLEEPFEKCRRAGGICDGVTLDMAVEWVTRITLSYMNDPRETAMDESYLRELLETLLVPALVKPGVKS